LGVHRQSQASPTSGEKPRVKVAGHPDFVKKLERLRDSDRSEDKHLASLIDDAQELLLENPTAGEKIPTDRWPKQYRDLDLPNLFRFKLDRRHRMTYSIIRKNSTIYVWILDALDHTEYNRLFGYN